MILFMRQLKKSRLSCLIGSLILVWNTCLIGQQKANDFTKRVGVIDGKLSGMSGRSAKLSRINPSTARRISVEEWPSHFSPFGGKRFPMGKAKIWGSERIKSTKIEIKTPLNSQVADENVKRVTNPNLNKQAPSSNSVEFRDAYYSRLDDRVDEWMEKVNNMSLRDVNRFQFRRDRPSKPGFPVQRAGASLSGSSSASAPLIQSGVEPRQGKSAHAGSESYWMGPKHTKSSSSVDRPTHSNNPDSRTVNSVKPRKNFKTSPKPILGPKTIRVEVGTSD